VSGTAIARDRLLAAISSLAATSTEPEVRAQLHALAGIVDNLGAEQPDPRRRAECEGAVRAAIEAEDEPAVVAAMRRLAELDRNAVRPLDWTAASAG
jgi:hypothetical protein